MRNTLCRPWQNVNEHKDWSTSKTDPHQRYRSKTFSTLKNTLYSPKIHRHTPTEWGQRSHQHIAQERILHFKEHIYSVQEHVVLTPTEWPMRTRLWSTSNKSDCWIKSRNPSAASRTPCVCKYRVSEWIIHVYDRMLTHTHTNKHTIDSTIKLLHEPHVCANVMWVDITCVGCSLTHTHTHTHTHNHATLLLLHEHIVCANIV